MAEKKWVQHISGQGEKWEVTGRLYNSESNTDWQVYPGVRVADEIEFHYLPKSEYRLCEELSEKWEDVTDEYNVINARVLSYTSEGFQNIRASDRLRKINHIHNGPCFIIERKKS